MRSLTQCESNYENTANFVQNKRQLYPLVARLTLGLGMFPDGAQKALALVCATARTAEIFSRAA